MLASTGGKKSGGNGPDGDLAKEIGMCFVFLILLLAVLTAAFFLYRSALTPEAAPTKVVVFQDANITIYESVAQGHSYRWGVTKDGKTVTFGR